ncbi:MAG: helix-turn-helix domain-containing protein [Nodosilinea sp.]
MHLYLLQNWDAPSTFFCPAGVPHQATWHQPLCNTVFCINQGFVNQVAPEMMPGSGLEFIPRPLIHDPNLYHLAMALKTLLSDPLAATADQIYGDQVITAMAAYLLESYGVRPLPPGLDHPLDNLRLRRLVEYVEAHLATEIALAPLAAALDLGEFQLCQAFLSRTGLSLYEFVQQQRQRRARLLLQVSPWSQEEIARCCGYGDRCTMIHHLGGSGVGLP